MTETLFESEGISSEKEREFHKKLFDILLKIPEGISSIEEAWQKGIARGAGIIMQEAAKDASDMQKNLFVAMLTKEKPQLEDLYPCTTGLIQRLMPYLESHGLGVDELTESLVDKEKFVDSCNEAAGDDPDMQKIARDMKKLMEMTDAEVQKHLEQSEEEEFVEEY